MGTNGCAVLLAALAAFSGAGGEDEVYAPETFAQAQLAEVQAALDLEFPDGVRGEHLFKRNRSLDPAGAVKLSVDEDAVAPLLERLERHGNWPNVHITGTLTDGLEWWTPEAGELLEERHYFAREDGSVGAHVLLVRDGDGVALFAEWYWL